jgi:hypothetical protein
LLLNITLLLFRCFSSLQWKQQRIQEAAAGAAACCSAVGFVTPRKKKRHKGGFFFCGGGGELGLDEDDLYSTSWTKLLLKLAFERRGRPAELLI